MIFKSLFKPKWKSKNPQVRRQALNDLDSSLPENQMVFSEVLKSDPDPIVRQSATRRVVDFTILHEISIADADATVREHALARLRRLLVGSDSDSPNIDTRSAFLADVGDTKLQEYVARQAKDVTLRESLMLQLNRDVLFGDIALQDVDPELRYKALQHVSQRKTLERVLKGARSKDKRIRLATQDLLAELTSKEERPEALKQKAKQLCARLDSLLGSLKLEPDSIRLRTQRLEIANEWRSIETAWTEESLDGWDEKISERYQRACDVVDKLLVGYAEQAERKAAEEHAYEPIRQEKERIYSTLTDVLKQLESQSCVDATQLVFIKTALEQAETHWLASGELPAEESRKTNQAFKEVVNKLTRRSDDVKRFIKAVATCESIIQKDNSDQAIDKTIDKRKRLRTVEKLWDSIEKPQYFILPEDLLKKAQSVLDKLKLAKQKSEQAREKNIAAFKSNTDALEKSLADGKYKQATKLTRQLHNNIKAIPNEAIKHLRDTGEYARYQRAVAQLKELRDWQGWASSPAREAICQEAETLADEVETYGHSPAYDFHSASKKVQQARQRWKTLGPSEGESDDMWDRFNLACNRAYELCQKSFEKEAEVREQNFVAKDALCVELEAFYKDRVEGKDEGLIDWKQMDRAIATALQSWKKIGPVKRQSHAGVRDRFNDIIQSLKEVLKGERDRNKLRKEELIVDAEKVARALAESDKSALELRDSSAAIKLIQASWKEIGYATEERKLWARFRVACDDIFNERQAQFDFQIGEQREHLAQKQTLCELVERISELSGEELEKAQTRVKEIKAEWRSVGDIPHDSKDIEKRFIKACRVFDVALDQYAQHLKNNQRQELYTMHELCVQLEVLADEYLNHKIEADEVSGQLELVKQTWMALVRNEQDVIVGTLDKRYQLIVAWLAKLISADDLSDDEKATFISSQEKNLLDKCEWCLALEILAGVDSPTEFEQDRMAMQVQMLARKHGQELATDSQLVDSINEIENKWYAAGSTSALETIQLERRFSLARSAPRVTDNPREHHPRQVLA